MTERRTGEGLQAIGSLAQGSWLLCSLELPVPRAPGPLGQPHSSGRRKSKARATVSEQYLVAGPLQPDTRQETLAAQGPARPAPLAHVLALDRR